MSKYNLEDLLNEYIGGGRIGTLKISFKDLQDKMDELENSDKVIVRTISGPSGDGKVNREFEVVDRDSAVPGGNKQERGFTVYDYKFGFDPGSEEHFMEEYDFSVGGNDLQLAMDLIDGVKAYGIGDFPNLKEDEDYEKDLKAAEPMELPKKFRDSERDQIEKDARKFRGDIQEEEGIGQLYVQPAVQKEIRFHLDAFEKGDIEVDDMIQAIEDIIFGRIPAPGMREGHAMSDNEADLEAGVKGNMDAFTEEVDVDLVKQTVARANNQIVTPGDMAGFILDVINQVAEKEQDSILNNNQMKIAIGALEKVRDASAKKPMEENGHVDDYADEIKEEEMIPKSKYDKLLDNAANRYDELEMQFVKFIQDEYNKDFDIEDFRQFQVDNSIMEDDGMVQLKEHFNRFMFKKYS